MNKIKKIFLHATYNCNAKCIHCSVPKGKSFISLENYQNTVDIGKDSGLEYMILGGGEPLLHPNILDMIE